MDQGSPLLSLCLASLPPVRPDGVWGAWSLAPETVLPLTALLLACGYGYRNWSRTGADGELRRHASPGASGALARPRSVPLRAA